MFHLTTRQFTGMWVLAAMTTQFTLSVVSLEDPDYNLHQRAQYYVRKLSETLEEMDAQSPRIQKRCASIPGFCENLIEVTQQACPNYRIDSEDTNTTTPVAGNTEGKPKTDSTDLQLPDNWNINLCPFLINATANRIEQNMIEVEFFVEHSSAVNVEIFMSFDSQKTTLDAPEKLETETGHDKFKISRVSLTFDSSTCHPEMGGETKKISFLPVQYSTCTNEAKIDICRLNNDLMDAEKTASVIRTENEELSRGETILDGGNVSQIFPIPRVSFSPDQGDTMFIEKGKNVSIEIDVLFYPRLELFLHGILWNWTSNEEVYYRVKMEIKGSKIDIDDHNDENIALVSVDILDETIVNTNEDGNGGDDGDGDDDDDDDGDYDDEYREILVRMRITVNVASGELSGMLGIVHSHEEKRSRKKVCDDVNNEWYIPLKFLNQMSTLPLNTFAMSTESVRCDENGNKDGRTSGNHCILQCHAWGSDIKSISITKSSSPFRSPLKSASFNLYDISASTMQDVGPASQDNDGNYTCTVTSNSGQTQSKEFSLTTSFTTITNFTVEHLDNSTTRFVCTAAGPGDVDIRIMVEKLWPSYEEESLEALFGAFIHEASSKTVLTILIPTDFEDEIGREVTCVASGDDGEDEMREFINSDRYRY